MSQLHLTGSREERRLARLVTRCGASVQLVPDTVLLAENIIDNLPAARLGLVASEELQDAVLWLMMEPLLSALQDDWAAAAVTECQHCQPAEALRVLFYNRSGSTAEGLEDGIVGEGGTSDHDVMLEIGGPLHWSVAAGAGEDCISPEAAPQLWARTTSNPGFVTLRWAMTTRCTHEAPLEALPADAIRRLLLDHCRILYPPDSITPTGPAVNVRPSNDTTGGVDHVPCLRLLWWPAEEAFLRRHRVTDFPPEAARRDICRFGVHLVPTGRSGSDTELSEWRVSFSRAEVVAVSHLTHEQHATLKAIKASKNILKDSKAVKLKSYHIKTAVLWLAQDQPSDRWTGVTAGVHLVLDWLEQHLSAGSMPCFFWPDIDLLASLSKAELGDMIDTVQLMRRQAIPLLMACCEKRGWDLEDLLEGGSDPLPERQLRLRLARRLVQGAVEHGIIYRPGAPCWESWMAAVIPSLAGSAQHQLLWWRYRGYSGAYDQQCRLLQALAVAPADVARWGYVQLAGDTAAGPAHRVRPGEPPG